MWTPKSTATHDMHYLIVYSRLRRSQDRAANKVADAVLGLDRKLEGQAQRNKQNWNARLVEVVTELVKKDPDLPDALLHHKDFVRPAHVALTACFDAKHRQEAAHLFLAAVKKDDDFAWSGPLIELLSLLPADEVRPVFRGQWDEYGLRDALLLQLTQKPEEVDRDKFLTGLESGQRPVVLACLNALAELPRDEEPRRLVPLVRLLRQLTLEPKEKAARSQVCALLARQTGPAVRVQGGRRRPGGAQARLRSGFRVVREGASQAGRGGAGRRRGGPGRVDETLANRAVGEGRGRPRRGAVPRPRLRHLPHRHDAARPRPDRRDEPLLARRPVRRDHLPQPRRGAAVPRHAQSRRAPARRFSASSLSSRPTASSCKPAPRPRCASPRRTSPSRSPSTRSLMPNGLLKGLEPGDLADLYCYLQTLKPPK